MSSHPYVIKGPQADFLHTPSLLELQTSPDLNDLITLNSLKYHRDYVVFRVAD